MSWLAERVGDYRRGGGGRVQAPVRTCGNCGRPVTGPDRVPGGQARAWHNQCRDCHELCAGQMEVVADRPGGEFIQFLRCRSCGTVRSCRPGWLTRCHVCLDGRSVVPGGLSVRECEARSATVVAEWVRRFARPGWEVVAADVHGLPWRDSGSPDSHGTWGCHLACGRVVKLTGGAVDCPACGPAPGARTFAARGDEPYLLYLVRAGRYQKFGVGDRRRVLAHVQGGAEVVQVLNASFADVVCAERDLKSRHRGVIVGRPRRGMIASFGQGTEVVGRHVPVSLVSVLPSGEDVTGWFG